MTIHVKPPFRVSPSPTTLRRRMSFQLTVWSDAPPEDAVFEYTSHRQDVYFGEGSPMVRSEEVDGSADAPTEVEHRIYLECLPGTRPVEAPISLVVRGAGGESYRFSSVIELQPDKQVS
jgi:hypothetical protein